MPEIAEVRVVANTLKKQILHKKITQVKILYSSIVLGNREDFVKKITNKEFIDITTNGKWLLFNMGEYTLLSHLRMEGKYFYLKESEPIGKHTHVIFTFEDGMELRYDDTRKFGRMELVKTDEVLKAECIKKLGYEPENSNLTPQYLLNAFKGKSLPIKSVLLDQSIINGLGNIYANEVLFASGINPLREPSSISEKEALKIIETSRAIVAKSYEMGGCTIRSYTSSLGVVGHYQDELKVHSRAYKKCYNCGEYIKCIKIGGRSTYYCEHCQK